MKHTHKLELSNVKLDCVRTKGEIERERDILHSQVEGKHPLSSFLLCFNLFHCSNQALFINPRSAVRC